MKHIFILSLVATSVVAQPSRTVHSTELSGSDLYQTHCAACHGTNMEGAQHAPLIKDNWLYGRDRSRMLRTIMYGIPNTDMIAWSNILSEEQCESLLDYVIESQDRPPMEVKPFPKTLSTRDYDLSVEVLIKEGFQSAPWAIEFVDHNRALITERREGLRWMVNSKLDPMPINGIPVATHYGDSGMFDLVLDPDYQRNGWVYISYVHPLGDPDSRETPAMTRVIRGRVNGHEWVDQETIFRVPDELHISPGRGPWGSRMLFDKEGRLFFSIGDSTQLDDVQVLSKPSGKIFRIYPDGTIPEDNPFVGHAGTFEAIYSIGNRNVQGIAQHPMTGDIWATEHGPMGGDELNVIEKGMNYGWPEISWGLSYEGDEFPSHKEGMEQPIKYWRPSPALCPLEFYSGNLFPKWKNHALVGALAFEEIKLLNITNRTVQSEEVLMKNHGRVRDLKTGPDGAIYVVLNNPHAVLRLTPTDP